MDKRSIINILKIIREKGNNDKIGWYSVAIRMTSAFDHLEQLPHMPSVLKWLKDEDYISYERKSPEQDAPHYLKITKKGKSIIGNTQT